MPEKMLEQGCEESVGNDDVSIVCNRILRSSLALRVISDILWSSCFESYGPKDTDFKDTVESGGARKPRDY